MSERGQQHPQYPGTEYSFCASFKIPKLLTAGRWLSRYGCDYTPAETSLLLPKTPPLSLTEKYGTCTEIVHYGRSSTVRVYTLQGPGPRTKQLHAVKVFRRSLCPWVVNRHYFEQAISTTLSHPNLLRTIDTMYNSSDELCLVMDYCGKGNLRSLVTRSEEAIDRHDADCYLAQILRAVSFLHDNGIAHRDLRLENILLTVTGIIKVTDFGSAEWVSDDNSNPQWDEEAGSGGNTRDQSWKQASSAPPEPKPRDALPYLAPEEFADQTLDARATDIWAIGIIYMVLRGRQFPWRQAIEEDVGYSEYLCGRRTRNGYAPLEALGETQCCNVVYAMLDPNVQRRITASEALRSEWLYSVRVCDAGEMGW